MLPPLYYNPNTQARSAKLPIIVIRARDTGHESR